MKMPTRAHCLAVDFSIDIDIRPAINTHWTCNADVEIEWLDLKIAIRKRCLYTCLPSADTYLVITHRGGKGKWGAQSPPPVNPLSPQAVSPILQPSSRESVVDEADSKHMHDRMLFLLSHMIVSES
jgi:hypothetical protein